MDPIATALAAAYLEGTRRALSNRNPGPQQRSAGGDTLVEAVQRTAENNLGLAGLRMPGTGERLDRMV